MLERRARDFGVARVTEFTALDRIGVPVFAAVRRDPLPGSVSLCSGASLDRGSARRSAIAEALERWSAEPRGHLATTRSPDPTACVEASRWVVAPSAEVETWVAATAWDASTVWVPAGAVFHPWPYDTPFAPSTNGMAWAESADEALRRATLELIERDAWTEAVIRSAGGRRGHVASVDGSRLSGPPRALCAMIHTAGLQHVLLDATGELGVPCALATLWDPAEATPRAHVGVAARGDFTRAAERALVEAVQGRAVDISGAREDLGPVTIQPPDDWYFGVGVPMRPPPPPVDDALGPLLARLDRYTAGPHLFVELSAPGYPGHVVRALRPGLEAGAVDPQWIGERALRWASER